MDRYRRRVISKYFSLASFSASIPFLVVGLSIPRESALYRSGPALGVIWFLIFTATMFLSLATIYVASFRRHGISSESLNCFDLVWIDPLDPIYLSAAGRWRLLTVFLLMAAFVDTIIFYFIGLKIIDLENWRNPIFGVFWGNVIYSVGLIKKILREFKHASAENAPTSATNSTQAGSNLPLSNHPISKALPLLGDDLCLPYRLYWVGMISVFVFYFGYASTFWISDMSDSSREISLSFNYLQVFLYVIGLIIGAGVLFGLGYIGAKLLRLRKPGTRYSP
jgi:hypothetical protein